MKKIAAVLALIAWSVLCHRAGYWSAWEEHQDWDNPHVPADPIYGEPIVEGR